MMIGFNIKLLFLLGLENQEKLTLAL